jgi:N-acetylmuramoyl-L-alanine amidase
MPWNSARRFRVALLLSFIAIFGFSQSPPSGSQPGPNQQPTQAPPQIPTPLVIIDPAHGGSDSGAALNAAMPEKDVTLVLARRLRQELASRGIAARLLRDGDVTLTVDERAEAVNGLHPSLYLAVHATSLGSGLRLYTALLPVGEDSRGPFLDWQTGQASALDRSRVIQEQITRVLQKKGTILRSVSAPVRPLNNITVPALAIEVAPSDADVSQLASADYQQTVCSALANALAAAVPLLTAHSGSPQ